MPASFACTEIHTHHLLYLHEFTESQPLCSLSCLTQKPCVFLARTQKHSCLQAIDLHWAVPPQEIHCFLLTVLLSKHPKNTALLTSQRGQWHSRNYSISAQHFSISFWQLGLCKRYRGPKELEISTDSDCGYLLGNVRVTLKHVIEFVQIKHSRTFIWPCFLWCQTKHRPAWISSGQPESDSQLYALQFW